MAPAAVSAAPPVRLADSQTGILCDLATEAGAAAVFVQRSGGETFANLMMWAPDAGPDDLPSIETVGVTGSFVDARIEIRFELAFIPTDDEPELRPAGSARVSATLTPYGELQDIGSRVIRDGNRRIDLEQTMQLLAVEGAVEIELLDGTRASADLESCGASAVSQSVFATAPNAYLTATDQLFVSCEWMTDAGAVEVLAIADEFTFLTQVVIVAGDSVALGFSSPTLTESAFSATYELFDPASGVTVGSASAHAELTATRERLTEVDWVDPYRFSVIGQRLSVDGTLTVEVHGTPTQLAMDDTACEAGDVRVQVMEKMPNR
jgi:hypothetical protein